MTELKARRCNEVGFVDPHIVFKFPPSQPNPNWKPETTANIIKFLVKQRDKQDILLPYNFK